MRIALGIEYDGRGYHGWQAQAGLKTIQDQLEKALSTVASENIAVFCAGRTDANVHALGQVVHFDTHAKRHIDAWIWGTNTHLPPTIVVRWAKAVDYHFHARFSALSRSYRYLIYNHPIRPGLLYQRATWFYYPLNADLMHKAGQFLLGEQNFSSFRSSKCNSKSPMRSVHSLTVQREGHFILLSIEANAFLHHMVRNIAGSLMKIGAGFKPLEWIQYVLEAKSRQVAGETAAPDGLYLTKVVYPAPYIFPQSEPIFLI